MHHVVPTYTPDGQRACAEHSNVPLRARTHLPPVGIAFCPTCRPDWVEGSVVPPKGWPFEFRSVMTMGETAGCGACGEAWDVGSGHEYTCACIRQLRGLDHLDRVRDTPWRRRLFEALKAFQSAHGRMPSTLRMGALTAETITELVHERSTMPVHREHVLTLWGIPTVLDDIPMGMVVLEAGDATDCVLDVFEPDLPEATP